MIKLNVSSANIAVEEKETLTEGRVGLLCQFRFTDEWTGLAKTAVFDGADSRDVILKSDTVAIPAECLAAEGYSLSVGVYGKNAAGDIVIPTVYATVGKIQRSAYPSGREPAAPTPDVVAQIQQAAANAEELARSVREDADLGKFNGGKGEKGEKGDRGNTGPAGEAGGFYTPAVTQPNANTMRLSFSPSKEGMPAVAETDITLPAGGGGGGSGEDGGYYTPAVTQTAENTMQVEFTPSKAAMPAVSGKAITLPAGPAGSKGDKGDKGADGKSAYQYAVEGGYTGTEAEFAAKLAQEKFANPNALTFTGAVTGSYDGSAPLSVEIPAGGGGSGDITDVLMDVTIEEAVAAVTVTLGTPRAYKELYIATCVYGDESNSSANAMFLRVNNTDTMNSKNVIAWIPSVENATSATSKSYGIAFVKLLDDCSFYYCYGSKLANARTPQSSYGEKYTVFNKETIISTLKFQSANQWTKFGVGSTIKVYGVRS